MSIEDIRLTLSHCQYPMRRLGYGRRMGIWLRGIKPPCSQSIAGMVPETWETRPIYEVPLSWLLNELLEWLNEADGVTISGGEPFDQPVALLALITALRTRCFGDILIYSGYSWQQLEAEHSAVIEQADVVVSGAVVKMELARIPHRCCANPQAHLLTALAQQRYTDWPCFDPEIEI